MPENNENLKPELDNDVPATPVSEVRPLVDADGNPIIRSVQLNEKINDTTYQILHPETDAYQVITDPNRRFVTDEEKKHWNKGFALGATAWHYQGEYDEEKAYAMGDVVYVDGDYDNGPDTPAGEADANYYASKDNGRRFFVCVNPELDTSKKDADGNYNLPQVVGMPDYNKAESVTYKGKITWANINYESYLAEHAKNVEVTPVTVDSDDYDKTFQVVASSGSGAGASEALRRLNTLTITPEEDKVSVGSGGDILLDAGNTYVQVGQTGSENTITLDGATGTVTAKKFIGDLEGNVTSADYAKVASQYRDYDRDEEGNIKKDSEGNDVVTSTPYIDKAIDNLNERINKITNGGEGGAVLANKLFIQKNGDTINEDGFNGSEEQTINITIATEDVTDLLDTNKKIKDEWLPDAILGAMKFIGTFNPETGDMIVDLRENIEGTETKRGFAKGDYAIAIGQGNLDPSKNAHVLENAEKTFFVTGDWAVYSGDVDADSTIDPEEWTKIDNTDAVRTVNNQIGNVQTYKGEWTPSTPYFCGDIVIYGEPAALYLCTYDHDGTLVFPDGPTEENPTNPHYFQIFGRVYQADDGIKLDHTTNTFLHKHNTAKTENATNNDSGTGLELTTIKLAPKETIVVSKVELEPDYNGKNFGHVAVNKLYKYEMPDDTWRPVSVNGTEYQGKETTTGNLNLTHAAKNGQDDARVTVAFDEANKKVIFNHENSLAGKGSHTSEILTTKDKAPLKVGLGSQFTAPNFGWGDTGHIDSYSKVVFELPEDLVQHKHFKVALVDGRSLIRSYTVAEYNAIAKDADKSRLFVDGTATAFTLPASTERMTFNGQFGATGLFQTGRKSATEMFRAVDESATLYGGDNKFLDKEIVGTFDATDNRFEMGDSGINEGVYSALAINTKGLAVAGGQILEFGIYDETTETSSEPSESLVIGGLFFRNVGPKIDDNGADVNYDEWE